MSNITTLLTATLALGWSLRAQTVDDTELKQVIIVGRHSVRAPLLPNSTLDTFSTRPFPDFGVQPQYLTPNGSAAEKLLGGYFRLWLTQEGLLTGNDAADAKLTYVRANNFERTIATAQAFASGLLPAATITVDSLSQGSDPLFDPIGAGVAELDTNMELAALQGRVGGNAQLLATAYGAELALTRSLLFNYPPTQTPPPDTPKGKTDVTALPIAIGTGSPANFGGISLVEILTSTFLMEYADGLPLTDVAWGQLNADGISQLARLTTLTLDLEFRTPYLDQIQSSNLASHVVRSLSQFASGTASAGSLGTPQTKIIVLIASDVNVTGLAALFNLDWTLPGYQENLCSPGGALVFQLRQSQSTKDYIVRASYIAQGLDQLRNKTALTLSTPPEIAPLFIPGCSINNATFDCPLTNLMTLANQAIDPHSADPVN